MKMFNKIAMAAFISAATLSAPVGAMARDLYGAIAYSQSTRYHAWATDFNSQNEAENAAMNECYNNASDCKVALWFMNACGALAVGSDGGWGSNWGNNYKQSQNKAIAQCQTVSGGCQVVVTKCITGY